MKILLSLSISIISIIHWMTGFQIDSNRAMLGYLFAFVGVLTIPIGCMFFVVIQHLTRAGWSVLVRRMAEFAMAAIPLFGILFIPIIAIKSNVFPWMNLDHLDRALIKKLPYLNINFFTIRAYFYFAIWTWISIWFYKTSIKQDEPERFDFVNKKNKWAFDLTEKMSSWSPVSMIFLAITTTFASFDWLMSLQPHWCSTVFGIYFFAGCFLVAVAFTGLMLVKSSVPVNAEHYQDLGKFIFGFTVFWAYISFSQLMLYWYSNIPEETEFYIRRLQNGWEYVSYSLICTNFFLPFFIFMSKHVKRNIVAFSFTCIWILLTHFIDIYWLIVPTTDKINWFSFIIYDISALIGILFLYISVILIIMRNKSHYPKGDPRLGESLRFENY